MAPASGLIFGRLEFLASDDEVLSVLGCQWPAEKIALAGRATFGGDLDELVFGFDTLCGGTDTDILPEENDRSHDGRIGIACRQTLYETLVDLDLVEPEIAQIGK